MTNEFWCVHCGHGEAYSKYVQRTSHSLRYNERSNKKVAVLKHKIIKKIRLKNKK